MTTSEIDGRFVCRIKATFQNRQAEMVAVVVVVGCGSGDLRLVQWTQSDAHGGRLRLLDSTIPKGASTALKRPMFLHPVSTTTFVAGWLPM